MIYHVAQWKSNEATVAEDTDIQILILHAKSQNLKDIYPGI